MSGNIYSIGQDAFRFQVWNLLGAIEGHITLYWHRASGLWCFRQHGDYDNMISYFPRHDSVRWPTESEKRLVNPYLARQLDCAAWYDATLTETKWEFLCQRDKEREGMRGYLSRHATVFDQRGALDLFDNQALKLFESASVTIW